jgi:hypothetical protein
MLRPWKNRTLSTDWPDITAAAAIVVKTPLVSSGASATRTAMEDGHVDVGHVRTTGDRQVASVPLNACIGLAMPGRPIGPGREDRSAGGARDRTGPEQAVHGGYTQSRAGRGLQRAGTVTTGAKESQARPPTQRPPGRPSKKRARVRVSPPGCREPSGLLPTRRRSPEVRPHPLGQLGAVAATYERRRSRRSCTRVP